MAVATNGSPELLIVMATGATPDQTEHVLARLQEAGVLPAGLDPAQLQLSLIALATFPVAFPNTSRMVTGMRAFSRSTAGRSGRKM